MFPGLDGLMTLSRREGIDVRPTLLRVITDLYVQTERHTADEERQFVELASRLIDEVDEPTRELVRQRLVRYAQTPKSIALQLARTESTIASANVAKPEEAPVPTNLTASDPDHATTAFFSADASQRLAMLQQMTDAPPKALVRATDARAARALVALEAAAFASDVTAFTEELGTVLLLPAHVATQIVADPGGEALACAAKSLAMPSHVFQRVLMFLDRSRGVSVSWVYRLSRLYDVLTVQAARSMVATWRGASATPVRARHQSMLHDDERNRARATQSERSAPRTAIDTSRTTRHSRG